MKYEYIGATGHAEIEVDKHFHDILTALDREEYNSDRKHSRRNPVSLERPEYEWLSDGVDFLGDLIRAESYARLNAAILQLTLGQQKLVREIFFENIPPSQIARRDGIGKSAISHRLNRIYKQLKKLLK